MRKFAILIGNDTLDRNHYGGDFSLNAPSNDLYTMEHICGIENMSCTKLYNSTTERVKDEIFNLSRESYLGDFVMIYFSGHGTQIPDSIDDEEDGYSESWCLYDRCFIDNEINSLLCGFKSDVRVLLISDSCHSGSIAKVFPSIDLTIKTKAISGIYNRNKVLYDQILSNAGPSKEPQASVISITACLDSQQAEERGGYSDFTQALDKTWSHGNYKQGYPMFVRDIGERLNSYNSTPQLNQLGFISQSFLNSKPFSK